MIDLKLRLDERKIEIRSYIDLVKEIEENSPKPLHINILYSNTYIILYNYIEATIIGLLNVLSKNIVASEKHPFEFIDEIQKEWIKFIIESKNTQLTTETRVDKILKIISDSKVGKILELSISKGGGGNFDDESIIKLLKKLKIANSISPNANRAIKSVGGKTYTNKESALKEIVNSRNKLAHGELPFSELGKNKSLLFFQALVDATFIYMDEIVNKFETFINQKKYLK